MNFSLNSYLWEKIKCISYKLSNYAVENENFSPRRSWGCQHIVILIRKKNWKYKNKFHFHVFMWVYSKRKNFEQHKKNFTCLSSGWNKGFWIISFPRFVTTLSLEIWPLKGNYLFQTFPPPFFFYFLPNLCAKRKKVISITLRTGHPLPYCIFSGSTQSWSVMDVYYSWNDRRPAQIEIKTYLKIYAWSFSIIDGSGNQI